MLKLCGFFWARSCATKAACCCCCSTHHWGSCLEFVGLWLLIYRLIDWLLLRVLWVITALFEFSRLELPEVRTRLYNRIHVLIAQAPLSKIQAWSNWRNHGVRRSNLPQCMRQTNNVHAAEFSISCLRTVADITWGNGKWKYKESSFAEDCKLKPIPAPVVYCHRCIIRSSLNHLLAPMYR